MKVNVVRRIELTTLTFDLITVDEMGEPYITLEALTVALSNCLSVEEEGFVLGLYYGASQYWRRHVRSMKGGG